MFVLPKIELASGRCVSPARDRSTADPVAVARFWADAGFSRLHVVDDDAIANRGANTWAIESIARDGAAELQVAAGSESIEHVATLLECGAHRVVLGPRAVTEIDWMAAAAEAFPGSLVVETNVHERRVVTRGWVRILPIDVLDLVEDLAQVPLSALLVAGRNDGSSGGLELSLLEDVVEASPIPVLFEEHAPTMRALFGLEQRGLAGVVVPDCAFESQLDPRAVGAAYGR